MEDFFHCIFRILNRNTLHLLLIISAVFYGKEDSKIGHSIFYAILKKENKKQKNCTMLAFFCGELFIKLFHTRN